MQSGRDKYIDKENVHAHSNNSNMKNAYGPQGKYPNEPLAARAAAARAHSQSRAEENAAKQRYNTN